MVQIAANTLGVDFGAVSEFPLFGTGTIQPATDGAHYQYAKASAQIAASDADCNITLSSGIYVAAASGGAALSPAVVTPSGYYAWFQL